MTLVAIVGIDGSGKTTLASAIAANDSHRYRIANWARFFDSTDIRAVPADVVGTFGPHTRAHFLLFLVSGLREHVIAPQMEDAAPFVLCESYYYKFYAKERVFGAAPTVLFETFEAMPAPGLIIDIAIDPLIAYGRIRERLNAYESPAPTERSFVEFQQQVRHQLDLLLDRSGIPILRLNARRDLAENIEECLKWLESPYEDSTSHSGEY